MREFSPAFFNEVFSHLADAGDFRKFVFSSQQTTKVFQKFCAGCEIRLVHGNALLNISADKQVVFDAKDDAWLADFATKVKIEDYDSAIGVFLENVGGNLTELLIRGGCSAKPEVHAFVERHGQHIEKITSRTRFFVLTHVPDTILCLKTAEVIFNDHDEARNFFAAPCGFAAELLQLSVRFSLFDRRGPGFDFMVDGGVRIPNIKNVFINHVERQVPLTIHDLAPIVCSVFPDATDLTVKTSIRLTTRTVRDLEDFYQAIALLEENLEGLTSFVNAKYIIDVGMPMATGRMAMEMHRDFRRQRQMVPGPQPAGRVNFEAAVDFRSIQVTEKIHLHVLLHHRWCVSQASLALLSAKYPSLRRVPRFRRRPVGGPGTGAGPSAFALPRRTSSPLPPPSRNRARVVKRAVSVALPVAMICLLFSEELTSTFYDLVQFK